MTHELHCPHCGCPILVSQNTARVREMDTVEELHREIEHLRATVARLRGTGFYSLRRVPDPGPAEF
jgi:hypothetical protein